MYVEERRARKEKDREEGKLRGREVRICVCWKEEKEKIGRQ